MTWTRRALAAACAATALGCSQTVPLAPPTGPAEGLQDVRRLTAPVPPVGVQPYLWGNATALLTPGPASGSGARHFSISITAGPGSLPGALPRPGTGSFGAVYLGFGNTGDPNGTNSMFAVIAGVNIVNNPAGGGTAVLTGINSEGLPFTIKVTDANDLGKADTIAVDAPGLFKGSAKVNTGDLRIVRALPAALTPKGKVTIPGLVYDNVIGLFIAQADADNGVIGPQSPFPAIANGVTVPVPQLPPPDAAPDDTVNQDEFSLARALPTPPTLGVNGSGGEL